MSNQGPVLVIGSTGYLGSKVVSALLSEGRKVRALVRPGTDPAHILTEGVEIARGDLMDRASLDAALEGADAVVTSAAGYNKRKQGDSAEIDTVGFKNLAEAAKSAGTRRVVLTGVLKAKDAPDVEHFYHKVLQENLLEEMGVPFVSIQPGSFLDQSEDKDFFTKNLLKGKMMWLGSTKVPMSWILTEDLARYLAKAVDIEGIDGQRIEVGLDRNMSVEELKNVIEKVVGKPIKLVGVPWWLVSMIMAVMGTFNHAAKDFRTNFAFFQTGGFRMSSTKPQSDAFGAPPVREEVVRRWLSGSGLIKG